MAKKESEWPEKKNRPSGRTIARPGTHMNKGLSTLGDWGQRFAHEEKSCAARNGDERMRKLNRGSVFREKGRLISST